MDYKEKYEQALEKARLVLQDRGNEPDCAFMLSNLFPELKESEDVRIELLNYLYDVHDDDEERARWITWLEKQGKLVEYYEDKLDRCACEYFNKGYKKALEKQGEQKPVVKTQMVYPKFRIGDVISPNVEDGKGDYTIIGFDKTLADYLVDGGNIPSCSIGIEFIDANFHIKKQKPVEWSEEDKKHYNMCLQYFATIKEDSIFYEDYLWLKSLRPQKYE